VQSVSITTEIVCSNPTHGEIYSIQHYVIKFVSDLRQVSHFSLGTPVSSTNKTDRHDITEILLKVALNTINHETNNCLKQYHLPDNDIMALKVYLLFSSQYQNPIPAKKQHIKPCY